MLLHSEKELIDKMSRKKVVVQGKIVKTYDDNFKGIEIDDKSSLLDQWSKISFFLAFSTFIVYFVRIYTSKHISSLKLLPSRNELLISTISILGMEKSVVQSRSSLLFHVETEKLWTFCFLPNSTTIDTTGITIRDNKLKSGKIQKHAVLSIPISQQLDKKQKKEIKNARDNPIVLLQDHLRTPNRKILKQFLNHQPITDSDIILSLSFQYPQNKPIVYYALNDYDTYLQNIKSSNRKPSSTLSFNSDNYNLNQNKKNEPNKQNNNNSNNNQKRNRKRIYKNKNNPNKK
eukprot:TRINITY_DN5427_c0_g1_i1.p1 TRINITY_DN5427_c0_g1~~TRINITY_DN5427_c0_g1_i1.p1  ORF type:complete len:289 (-),score=76.99 TRINITY_DN5427_c0_g1_i1:52-918(-)